ncbi:hypothetical protein G195_000845 [Phytophthora kernoviae 00238/432]|uniref:START domain-containing protein n=1 Tax=Phytophthora kernoviae 00238/432 TaxID=1284355 RepID=A0A8J4SUN9_9STRA|nr:hypothetical protein G195_000845 [Phytophthora kernoviae 00238/432]
MNYFFGEIPAEEQVKPEEPTYATADDVDFEAYGKENIQILLNRHTGEDKVTTWELVDDADNVFIWRGAVEGSAWSPFRASRRINADKRLIEKHLLDPDRTMELDDMMEAMVTLRSIGDSNRLAFRHITSKGVFPIYGREFVVVTHATTLEDGRVVIATRSVPVAEVEPLEGYVRGITVVSGYIIEEHKGEDGKVYCDVTLLAHADLSGYIPPSVVNMLGTSATVKILENLETMTIS